MPFFIAIWKTFLVLSLTHHSVGADWNNDTPHDQTSSPLTGSSSISTLDDGPSAAKFSLISDSINGESTSKQFPAIGMDISCFDSNHNSPIKIRARRGNSPSTSCPSNILPQDPQKPPKNPQQPIIDGGKAQGGNADGLEEAVRIFRSRLKLEPVQNPCGSKLPATEMIPVCDSGYIGPTTVITECRYWDASRPCIPHRENLWCCSEVRLGRPPDFNGNYFDYDFDYPYYGIDCVVITTNWHWNPI